MRAISRVGRAVLGTLVVLVLAGCAGGAQARPVVTVSADVSVSRTPVPDPSPVTPTPVDASTLPVANPWAVLPAAPADPDPHTMPSGELAAPTSSAGAVLYTAPGGTPFAVLPQQAYRGLTRYPVIAHHGDWLQVLLVVRRGLPSVVGPTGVDGATGWVLGSQVTLSRTDTVITANLAMGTLTITTAGQVVATTQVGFGAPATPTPTERTFVMSIAANPEATYSKVFVYLGAHSATLDSFLGGPAQIAIHSYASHVGAISNGCLRIPANRLDAFASVPLGTPVLVVGG